MEKSLFIEQTSKFFPTLVTRSVTKLNDKMQGLSYLFPTILRRSYSADGRWASLLTKNTRVKADIVALDSTLPLISRDAIEKVTGTIPKMGVNMYLSEKQMKDLMNMLATPNIPANTVIAQMFQDAPRVVQAIYESIEDMTQSQLSTGVGIVAKNKGTGCRVDVGFYDENKFGVAAVWSANNAKPLDDIKKVFDKAADDGNVITEMYCDDTVLNALYANEQVRGAFGFAMNYVGGGQNVPSLDFTQLANLFERRYQVTLHRVSRRFLAEANGEKTKTTAWANGVCAFTCGVVCGDLVWTELAEMSRPVAGVTYERADGFILVSRYSENNPLREFTSSQAMVVPVLSDVDKIYLLNSTEVQA